MSLFGPSLIAAASSASIRILGFIRDVLLAQVLGAGPAADAFLAAFRAPNAIRRILAEGGLNPAFIPLYTRLHAENLKEAQNFAKDSFSGLVLVLLGLLALLELFTSFFALILFPGLNGEAASLAIWYSRLCFPLMVGVSLAACLSALLNAERRIALAALAPNIVNVTMIVALLLSNVFSLSQSSRGAWVALSAGLSGFLHLAIMVYAIRYRLSWFRLKKPHLTHDVKLFLKSAAPTVLIVGTAQISIIAAAFAASFLPSGISWLYYAERLFQFPLGFVGTVTGLVLLPELASLIASQNKPKCIDVQNRALETALLFSFPASVALFILAPPIIHLLFERGAFSSEDTYGAALALKGLAIGLPFGAIGKVLSQTVFVASSLRSAVFASMASILATILFALLFVSPFGIFGVCFAISLGLMVHASACGFILHLASLWKLDARFYKRTCSTVAATLIMAVFLIVFIWCFGALSWTKLISLCLGGMCLFAVSAFLFGAVTLKDLQDIRWSKGKKR